MNQNPQNVSTNSILSETLPESLKERLAKNAINLWSLKHILPYWAMHSSASQTLRWQEKNNQAVFNATFKPECKPKGAEGEEMDGGLKMGDESHNHHYYPPQPQQQSTGAKLAGPLLIAASLLGTGGLGTAGYIAGKAIDKIATQQGKVEDGKMKIEFIGGAETEPESQ